MRNKLEQKTKTPSSSATITYQAGCKRVWTLPSSEPDLAYTLLEFPECPECPHRVEPDGGPSFCTLRPVGTKNPFANLLELDLPDG